MINEEQHEKQLRIRYIRVLEKFLTRTNSLLRLENFDSNLFKERVRKNYKDIAKVKVMELHSPYLTNLKKYIDLVMFSIQSEEDFKPIQERLLKEANLLHKEKSAGSYKKDKHKKSKFDDDY